MLRMCAKKWGFLLDQPVSDLSLLLLDRSSRVLHQRHLHAPWAYSHALVLLRGPRDRGYQRLSGGEQGSLYEVLCTLQHNQLPNSNIPSCSENTDLTHTTTTTFPLDTCPHPRELCCTICCALYMGTTRHMHSVSREQQPANTQPAAGPPLCIWRHSITGTAAPT